MIAHLSSLASPFDVNVKLRAKEGKALSDGTYYRKLVGKLVFLTNTRPEIAFSVQHFFQFMQDPREPHLQVAFHVLRYLKSDPTLGLFLFKDEDFTIKGYYDSDCESCLGVARRQSNKLEVEEARNYSLSSAKVEYRSLRKVVGELVWLS